MPAQDAERELLAHLQEVWAARRRALSRVIDLLRCDIYESRLLERLADSGDREGWVERTVEEMASERLWLNCKQTKAYQVIRWAVRSGLVQCDKRTVEVGEHSETVIRYRLDWEAVERLDTATVPVRITERVAPDGTRSVIRNALRQTESPSEGPGPAVGADPGADPGGDGEGEEDGDAPVSAPLSPRSSNEFSTTTYVRNGTERTDGACGAPPEIPVAWKELYDQFALKALPAVWCVEGLCDAPDPQLWSDLMRLAAFSARRGWTAAKFQQAAGAVRKPDHSTRLNVFKGVVARKCGFPAGLKDPQFILEYDAIEVPLEFLRPPRRRRSVESSSALPRPDT